MEICSKIREKANLSIQKINENNSEVNSDQNSVIDKLPVPSDYKSP